MMKFIEDIECVYKYKNKNIINSLNRTLPILKRENEIYLVFQPQINIRTNKIDSFEVLTRWNNPILGNLQPVEFIKFIKSINKIKEFDLFVFEEAFKFQKELMERKINHKCAVNITLISLKDSNVINEICNLIGKYFISPQMIIIEICEEEGLENNNNAKENLKLLKKKGFKISMDDFGVGYSMFNRIKNVDFDEIKIPRELIVGIERHNKQYKILEAIIKLARDLSLDTVVEGIELPQQLDIISEMGVDRYQGFLKYPPLTKNKYIEVMNKN